MNPMKIVLNNHESHTRAFFLFYFYEEENQEQIHASKEKGSLWEALETREQISIQQFFHKR